MRDLTAAKKDETKDISQKDRAVLERVEKERKRRSGRLNEEVLTGKSNIVDFLKFREEKRKKAEPEDKKEEDNVVNLEEYKRKKAEEGKVTYSTSPNEERRDSVSPSDEVVGLDEDKRRTTEDKIEEIVEQYSWEKTEELEGNDNLSEKIRETVRELIVEDEPETKETKEQLAESISENSENNEEILPEIEAKKILLEVKKIKEDHPDEVRETRRENLAKKFEEETKKKNQEKKPSEDQAAAIQDEAKLLASVYYGNEGVREDNFILDSDQSLSGEKKKVSRLEIQGVVGLLSKKPEETKEIINRHSKNRDRLVGVELPFGEVPQYSTFDRITNALETRNTGTAFDLIQKGGWRQRVKNLSQNRTNSLLEIDGGFISRINGQNSAEFVQNSMVILASPKSDFYSGFRNILSGISDEGGGVTVPNMPTGINIGGTNSLGNGLSNVGNLLSGRISNGLKDLGTSLGAGVKKGLASGFNGLGGAIKGITNAVPQVRAAKTAVSLAIVIVIGVIFGIMGISLMETNSQISSIVPPVKNPTEYNDSSGSGVSGPASLVSCASSSQGLNIDNIFDKIDISTITTKVPQSAYVYKTNGSKDIDFSCLEKGLPEKGTNKRADILKAAYALLGVPYFMTGGHGEIASGIDPVWGTYRKASSQYGNDGRNYNGLDCSGFVRWVYKYVTGENIGNRSGDIYSKAQPIDKSALIPGDIAYMPGHIGIFFGRGTDGKYYFIHSSGRGSKAGPQALGGVLISTAKFTKFARAKVNLQ